MIPVLFERDEVDFQSNGIGQLPNVIESYAYEIGNAEYELNLKYPTVNDVDGYSNSIWKELKITERQILYKPSHSRKPHAFRIYNYEIDSVAQTITVYGRSRAYDLGNNVVKTVNINNQTPQAAMNTMKTNLVEPTDFDFYSDMSTTSSTKWERQSGLSTIMGEEGSLIQYWGGEVLRENTRISLYNRVGKDNVTTLRLGKNIEQLNYDLRTDNMVTAIIPFYRYTPEGENREEIVVTGNTVKSSKFNNYRLPYYQFIEYTEQDDNVTNLTTLNNAASKWFSEHPNVDEPTLTINVDMVDVAESTEYAELLKSLEQVNVFDTVSVYISEYDIDVVVKVVSLKYDGFNERNLEVELGSASSGLFETFVNPQFDNISKQLDDVRKIGVIAQISADGKNTNYQGSVDPNEAGLVGDDGDIYFRTVGTEKQMWQYQVNQWNLILDTSRIDVVEKEVSTIIAQADLDRTAVEEAINQAIIDANAYAEQQTSALKTEVEASNETLEAAISTAQNRADAAFADAEIAKNNAFAATQTAQTAINDSITAVNNAQTALDSLTAISGDLSELDQSVQTKFTSIDGQISNMVTQTTFNALDQKVTSQGTLISQTQSTLLSKADKTVVDAINQTVGQHTTQIEQNAQAITARLTETQINSLLGTKNYVNQTTLTATASGLNASITQVSSDLEGLEGDVLEQFTTIEATIQGLQTTVGNKAEQSQVTQLAGQISSKVESSTYTSKMTQLDSAISQRVTSTTFESRITQLDNSIDLKVSSGIDGLEIGGRNYFNPNATPIYKIGGGTMTFNDDVPYGFYAVGDQAGTLVGRINNVITGNGLWTISFDLRGSQNGGGAVTVDINNLGNIIVRTSADNEYKRYSVTIDVDNYGDGTTNHFVDFKPTWSYIWVKNIKIEKGNKATDFSYAIDDAVTQINLSTEGVLIAGKRIQLDGDVTMTAAFVNDLNAKTLSAITANITTIRSQVLQANVVTSTHLQTSTATIDKLFATDAMITRLTTKSAFIGSIKTIDLSATRITTGTLNAANVSIINLNANNIVTGTISGANSSWNLNTGLMTFTNPSTNDRLQLTQGQIQFQNGAQTRLLQYNAEGLQLRPGTGNTGTSLNTSLHLIGGGIGSHQYVQFVSGDGFNQRLETVGNSMTLQHASGGLVLVKAYGADNHSGIIRAARFETSDATGNTLEMDGDQIRTPRDGSRNIFLTPQGTGAVIAGASGGIRYNVNASDFVKQSSRTTKTNIVPLQGGLDVINTLTPVSYNKIDKLSQGIYEVEKGFISEDSPMVATPDRMGIYDSHITAHLVKAVQELDVRTTSETEELKAKITELELKIQQLESAA